MVAAIPVGDYLSSAYDPDVDFVEGELEDRHVGDEDLLEIAAKGPPAFRHRQVVCDQRGEDPDFADKVSSAGCLRVRARRSVDGDRGSIA